MAASPVPARHTSLLFHFHCFSRKALIEFLEEKLNEVEERSHISGRVRHRTPIKQVSQLTKENQARKNCQIA
ncbi:hypothetical protein [Nostoc sp.]|uniref:hypothetical protein n=1 Tax=Nostoc sp. TaxID=1180 RepID=UPI002FFBA911